MSYSVNVFVKKLYPDAMLPAYSDDEAAGADIFAHTLDGPVALAPMERLRIGTGIAFDITPGYYGKVFDRSGVSFNKGLLSLGGVLDSNYRGEVFVTVINLDDKVQTIFNNMKIAQVVFHQYFRANLVETDELTKTSRGDKGFGSTGE